MRKEKLHKASLILGSIVALTIVFSQYLTPERISSVEKVKTEPLAGEEGSFISLPTFSLPVPVTVQASLNAYCLFEIFFEVDIDENYVEDEVSFADRFFETMFRVIISPNAP